MTKVLLAALICWSVLAPAWGLDLRLGTISESIHWTDEGDNEDHDGIYVVADDIFVGHYLNSVNKPSTMIAQERPIGHGWSWMFGVVSGYADTVVPFATINFRLGAGGVSLMTITVPFAVTAYGLEIQINE